MVSLRPLLRGPFFVRLEVVGWVPPPLFLAVVSRFDPMCLLQMQSLADDSLESVRVRFFPTAVGAYDAYRVSTRLAFPFPFRVGEAATRVRVVEIDSSSF